MSTDQLLNPNSDDLTAETEAIARMQTRQCDEAFVAAMAKAIKRCRETAVAGTFVDTSAPIHARRIVPEASISLSGSPGRMCVERDVSVAGTRRVGSRVAK